MDKYSQLIAWGILTSMSTVHAFEDFPVQFLFNGGIDPVEGTVQLAGTDPYTSSKRYGSDLGTRANDNGDPFYFSIAVPDGNYRVIVAFGHEKIGEPGEIRTPDRLVRS